MSIAGLEPGDAAGFSVISLSDVATRMVHSLAHCAQQRRPQMMTTFEARRAAALSILTNSERLTRKAGSFLGQLATDPTPMTPAQLEWFVTLAHRGGVSVEGIME